MNGKGLGIDDKCMDMLIKLNTNLQMNIFQMFFLSGL